MEVSEKIGWRYSSTMGVATNIPSKTDLLHVIHGTVSDSFFQSRNKGVRIIRDPRDVIVSGYLYHQRCSEKWCVNSDFSNPSRPFPQVPWPLVDADLAAKEEFVSRLDGLSYQEKISSLSKAEGLIFEMDGFAKITIDEMIRWKTKGTQLYQELPNECKTLMKECSPLSKIEENRKEKQKITFDTWGKTKGTK